MNAKTLIKSVFIGLVYSVGIVPSLCVAFC